MESKEPQTAGKEVETKTTTEFMAIFKDFSTEDKKLFLAVVTTCKPIAELQPGERREFFEGLLQDYADSCEPALLMGYMLGELLYRE